MGTLEGQVFGTQRGEALLHHLIGHFLQRGGVPLGTLVLVYQNCRRGQKRVLRPSGPSGDVFWMPLRRTGSHALVEVRASLQGGRGEQREVTFCSTAAPHPPGTHQTRLAQPKLHHQHLRQAQSRPGPELPVGDLQGRGGHLGQRLEK